jgi:prepilin-type N-terminal cleavage/methylation domain-containing protein
MQWAKRNSGFTIVELVVVIVIIAILTAISVVAYNGVQNNARASATSAAVRQANDTIKLWMAKNGGAPPTSLAQAGVTNIAAQTKVSLSYSRYDNNTGYCLAGYRTDKSNISYFKTSWNNNPVSAGTCNINAMADNPSLAFNEFQHGTTISFPEVSGTPDLILYVAFTIYNTDTAWNALGRLTSTNGSTMQIDTGGAGSAALRYRLDAGSPDPVFTNVSASQNVRSPGFHVGWVQVSEEGTVRSMAFDQAEAFHTGSLPAGANWAFNGIQLGGSNTSQYPYIAAVFNETHDEKTRARIIEFMRSYE